MLAKLLAKLLANLLAMPVVSAEVMPMGILGVQVMPFGFDAVFWKLMGYGIDSIDTVALWVTSLPGAIGHVRAFGTGPLLLGTAAILLLCLLRTPLRWSGATLARAASLWVMALPRPDVLIAGDGQAVAIRGGDGRLTILHKQPRHLHDQGMAHGRRRRASLRMRACTMACNVTPSAASEG